MNAYLNYTLEALAYIEKNAHKEETVELRRGLRGVAKFLEAMIGKEIYKPKKYTVYLNGLPHQCFALESDAKKYAENYGGQVGVMA